MDLIGSKVWPSAHLLSNYILDHKDLFKDKVIFEVRIKKLNFHYDYIYKYF